MENGSGFSGCKQRAFHFQGLTDFERPGCTAAFSAEPYGGTGSAGREGGPSGPGHAGDEGAAAECGQRSSARHREQGLRGRMRRNFLKLYYM